MADDVTTRYIAKKKAELAAIEEQLVGLGALQTKRDLLLAAIKSAEAEAADGNNKVSIGLLESIPAFAPGGEEPVRSEKSVWKDARTVLEKHLGTGLSLEEIRVEMCATGWELEGKPGREKIRTAIRSPSGSF